MAFNTTPVENLTYNQALEELQSIISMMQDNRCDVDQLTAYTRRAAVLLAECKKRLTVADDELKKILESITEE